MYRIEILSDEGLLLKESLQGNTHMVRKLLYNRMLDVNMTNWNESTPLMGATRYGHNGVVKLLLDRGADPNRGNKNRATALIVAVPYDHQDTIKQLIHGKAYY